MRRRRGLRRIPGQREAKHSVPDTTGGSFRGRLKALSIADILEFLRALNRRGLLSVGDGGVLIDLYLRSGRLIHATSTRDSDRLTDCLLRDGLMTAAGYDEVMRRAAAGDRINKALVGSGTLTPRALLEARGRQVRRIVLSLFEWVEGEFVFIEGEEPPDAGVAVDLELSELIVSGIRSVQAVRLFHERLAARDRVVEALPADASGPAATLEPQEEYVLRLVDGCRSVGEIVDRAEFPEAETLRVLFLLSRAGRLKMRARSGDDEGASAHDREPVDALLQRYNGMFSEVYSYLMKELGPISEHLLLNSLRETQVNHPILLDRASLGGDGTLDPAVLQENVRSLPSRRRGETVVEGLNELLYAELLTVRRTLGPGHEGRVVRSLRPKPPRTLTALS